MKINQFVGRRLILVTSLVLTVFLIIAISEAALNISREKTAISNLLVLTKKIDALNTINPQQYNQKLSEIVQYVQTAEFMHVDIKIKNAAGEIIAENKKAQSANYISPLTGKMITHYHNLGFEDGESIPTQSIEISNQNQLTHFDLTPNSASEEIEAGSSLLTTISMLVSLSLLIYIGMKLALDRAFDPLKDALLQLHRLSKNEYQGILKGSEIDEVRMVNNAINTLSNSLISLEQSRAMLSAKLISTQEDERARISRELHDELGQKIAVIRFNVGYLEKFLFQAGAPLQAIEDIKSALKDIDVEVKTLLRSLKSDQNLLQLSNQSLKKLLIELIDTWKDAVGQQAQFNFSIDLGETEIPSQINLTIFRITQEALTNISKHAQAKKVEIIISSQFNKIHWSIQDDGVGIPLNDKTVYQKGNGLAGIQERLWSIGSTLKISTANEGGCTLKADIPIELSQPKSAE